MRRKKKLLSGDALHSGQDVLERVEEKANTCQISLLPIASVWMEMDMANRGFLLNTDAFEDQLWDNPHVTTLRVGANIMPVFWCSLFSADDLRIRLVPTGVNYPAVFPVLFTESGQAQQRAAERLANCARFFPHCCSPTSPSGSLC